MTAEDEIKKAELRGYARGYQAGKARKRREDMLLRERKERQAFLDKAFLAALPACILAKGWAQGDKRITNIPDKTNLARDFAVQALTQRPTA